MAVSPDDRFAGLVNASAERGGWVPGDIYTADTEGEEEPVPPRRVRLPILIALAVATTAVLVLAFYVFRPTQTQSPSDPTAGGVVSEGPSAEAADDQGGSGESGSAEDSAGPGDQPANQQVVAHVTGEVANPSVVTLPGGSRVSDAVEAAGGLTGNADAEAVNLARLVADGEQIRIPAVGETPAGQAPGGQQPGPAPDSQSPGGQGPGAPTAPAPPGSGPGAVPGGKIDLNTADSATLETLPGVGPVTAQAIITHREQTPFTSVEDLLLVKGIGPKTFESLKDLVTVG